MNRRILRQLIAGVIFVLLSVTSFYYANRLYQLSPDASATRNIQIPQNGLRTQSEINVKDAIFTIENSSLTVSTTRVANSDGLAIFDIAATITAPLYPSLNITYSMYLSTLDPANVSSGVSLHLFNGTHIIVLQYYVGNKTVENSYQNYIYVQYQIGNTTDIWFKGTRNIWDDVANAGVNVNTSWKITTIVVGLVSFSRDNPEDDSPMQAIFELNETQLKYGDSRLAIVESSSITFSQTSFFGLIVSTSAFCVWSAAYLILSKRNSQIKSFPS